MGLICLSICFFFLFLKILNEVRFLTTKTLRLGPAQEFPMPQLILNYYSIRQKFLSFVTELES